MKKNPEDRILTIAQLMLVPSMFIAAFSSVMLLKVVNLKFEYILVFEVIFGVLMMILITKDKSESDANQSGHSILWTMRITQIITGKTSILNS